MLTQEELTALESSPVCLNCNHKELLHADYDCGVSCLVPECMCYRCIVEGDYSPWSYDLLRYKCPSLVLESSTYLEEKLLSLAERSFNSFREDNLSTGKIIRIRRYKKFSLPCDTDERKGSE